MTYKMTPGWLLRFIQIELFCFIVHAEISEWQEKIKTYLYTSSNPQDAFLLKFGNDSNVKESKLNPHHETKVIIHGWNSRGDEYWVHAFRDNYFKVGNYNIIVPDWHETAMNLNYLAVLENSQQFGRYIGEILDILRIEKNISFENVHILGHSLGAHIAGSASNFLKSGIGRITGLDPAAVIVESTFLNKVANFLSGIEYHQLNAADAIFVDVIHTCTEYFGFSESIGNIDFYPHEGPCKEKCKETCDHSKAYEYMIESIIYEDAFIAVECGSWEDYYDNRCEKNNLTIMGENVNRNISGIYYLETNLKAPYGRGIPNGCSNPTSKNYHSECGECQKIEQKKFNAVFLSV